MALSERTVPRAADPYPRVEDEHDPISERFVRIGTGVAALLAPLYHVLTSVGRDSAAAAP